MKILDIKHFGWLLAATVATACDRDENARSGDEAASATSGAQLAPGGGGVTVGDAVVVAPVPPVSDEIPEAGPGTWEVARGPDGAPLPVEVRADKALQDLEALRAGRRALFDAARQGDSDVLAATIAGERPAHERVMALRALGGNPNAALRDVVVAALADANFEVRSEAAVTLALWGDIATAMPWLKEFAGLGAQLRRAFERVGPDGATVLLPEALDFFRHALSSPVTKVRVTAAVGLVEMGEGAAALDVLEAVALRAERYDERVFAVAQMAPLRADAAVRTLLARVAAGDEPQSAERARRVLAGEVAP